MSISQAGRSMTSRATLTNTSATVTRLLSNTIVITVRCRASCRLRLCTHRVRRIVATLIQVQGRQEGERGEGTILALECRHICVVQHNLHPPGRLSHLPESRDAGTCRPHITQIHPYPRRHPAVALAIRQPQITSRDRGIIFSAALAIAGPILPRGVRPPPRPLTETTNRLSKMCCQMKTRKMSKGNPMMRYPTRPFVLITRVEGRRNSQLEQSKSIHLAYNCLIAFKAFGIYLISSLYIL